MFDLAGYTLDQRLLMLVLASYLALLVGGPKWLHHLTLYDVPARAWRSFIALAEQKLNRAQRTSSVRRFRGKLLTLILIAITLTVSVIIVMINMSAPWGWYVELAALTYLLPVRAATLPVQELRYALLAKDRVKVREAAALFPTLYEEPADSFTAVRAAIAYLSEALPRYIIAPSLLYMIGGLPALMLCRLLVLLLDMFPVQQHKSFIGFAHILHKLILVIPTHITCVIMWIALVFVPKSSAQGGLQAFQHQLPGALPVKLAAYGLRYTLGGQSTHDSYGNHAQWIGEGKARLDINHLTRTLLWYVYATSLWILGITAAISL